MADGPFWPFFSRLEKHGVRPRGARYHHHHHHHCHIFIDSIIKVNWKDMEFDHEEHARTGHNLLRTSEELIETLEENQVRHEQANKET